MKKESVLLIILVDCLNLVFPIPIVGYTLIIAAGMDPPNLNTNPGFYYYELLIIIRKIKNE